MLYACSAPERQVPQPTKGQQAMIDRKYGMFLHFGMNTYLNVEWSDGTALASTYAPPADMAEKAASATTDAVAAATTVNKSSTAKTAAANNTAK